MTLLRMLLTPPLYSAHMHRVSCELAGNEVPVLTTFNYIKLHYYCFTWVHVNKFTVKQPYRCTYIPVTIVHQ